jgi:hypothetical protein
LNNRGLLSQDATTAAAKEFLTVASNMDDYPFGIVSEDAVFTEYEVKGTP